MTLKRFCDICKSESVDGYAFLNHFNNNDTTDLCRNCEKAVLATLAKRRKK